MAESIVIRKVALRPEISEAFDAVRQESGRLGVRQAFEEAILLWVARERRDIARRAGVVGASPEI